MAIYCNKISEVRREKKFLEKELHIKIKITGNSVLLEGETIKEYETEMIIDAINIGFPARIAALLKDENFLFEKINIKDFTRRKNIELIRGRIIGTRGKTRKTIEQISQCFIRIKGNIVGIIGPAESVEYATTALANIIKGAKQTNAYKYLEKINTKRKEKQLN